VPPLPKRPVKRLEDEFLNKRKGKLQLFLDNLLIHPIFNASELVAQFLSKEQVYDKIMAEHDKMQRPKGIMHFTTIEGRANIGFSKTSPKESQDIAMGTQRVKKDLAEYPKQMFNVELD